MKQIGSKKGHRFKLIMQKVCWKMNDLLKKFRDKTFCYYEVDVQEVKKKAADTNVKAEKFEQVKEALPSIYAVMDKLKRSEYYCSFLESENRMLKDYLTRLYVADIASDKETTRKIFKELFEEKMIGV